MGPRRDLSRRDAPTAAARRVTSLTHAESLAFLDGASHGRIVYRDRAVPVVLPAVHVLERGKLIIRPHPGAAGTAHPGSSGGFDGIVVYEADALDPATHVGWSVIVNGRAERVTDARGLARYRVMLEPWLGAADGQVVRLHPDEVTGVYLTAAPRPASDL